MSPQILKFRTISDLSASGEDFIREIDDHNIAETVYRAILSTRSDERDQIRIHSDFIEAILVTPTGTTTLSDDLFVGYLMIRPQAEHTSEAQLIWDTRELDYARALKVGYHHIGTLTCGEPLTAAQSAAHAYMHDTENEIPAPFVPAEIARFPSWDGTEIICHDPCISLLDALKIKTLTIDDLTHLMIETLDESRIFDNPTVDTKESDIPRRHQMNRPPALQHRGFWSKVHAHRADQFPDGFDFRALSELEASLPVEGSRVHFGDQLVHNTFFAPTHRTDHNGNHLVDVTHAMYLRPGDPTIGSPVSEDGFVTASIVATQYLALGAILRRNIPHLQKGAAHAAGMWTKATFDEADARNIPCSVRMMEFDPKMPWYDLPADVQRTTAMHVPNGSIGRLEHSRVHANAAFMLLGAISQEPRIPYLSVPVLNA